MTYNSENGVDLSTLQPMDVGARVERVADAFEESCDAMLVTKPVNVRWLTGFTGSNAAVVIAPDSLAIVTDGRYTTQVEEQLESAGVVADVVIGRNVLELAAERAGQVAAKLGGRVGLESHHVTWSNQTKVDGWLPDSSLVALGPIVDQARQIKDDGEIARLVAAASIADQALASLVDDLGAMLRAGPVTERTIALQLEANMLRIGADGISFPTIVASGPNSALPHASPSDRELAPEDLLVIDMGASVDGYGSDMTRTFVIDGFTSETKRLYDAVSRAQTAGLEVVTGGVETMAVDQACRSSLEADGLGDAFIHGTGHGIGLEIHEDPFLSPTTVGNLRAQQVVTVEPGVYLPGLGGVRIEDSVVVGSDGNRPITHSPKQPVIS